MNNNPTDLNNVEIQRYARHFALPSVGVEGQKRLKQAKVLCVGAGGLGSPALLYLAAAGIGTLGIVENDLVDLSNLQRQILFSTNDIGNNKADAAKARLSELNPLIQINTHQQQLMKDNALDIIASYDFVLDCTDNFYTRFLINDACFYLNKPYVYASVLKFEGQCSVFSSSQGPCYRCLFETPPPPELIPNCAEAGVIGALPGILGSMQAMEIIKLILNQGSNLIGRLLIVDALTMKFRELSIVKNKKCPLCEFKIPFDDLEMPKFICNKDSDRNEISVHDLKNLQQSDTDFLLLDVREPFEYAICNIGGHLIPLNDLDHRVSELNLNQLIIVYCKSGGRSNQALNFLSSHGFQKVKSLKGGILAWMDEIDSTLQRY